MIWGFKDPPLTPALSPPGRGGSAFTLVEVLVVVGILGVLFAILLPVIAKARASADRAGCLSNLRQVHHAFTNYAIDNRDQVPLGYRANRKQFNSMVYSSTAQKLVLFGWLYKAGLMDAPRVFFCPAETSPQAMFNTPENPWPPGPEGNPAAQVYSGYGCRPEIELPDDPAMLSSKLRMPRLSEFRSKAIFGDLTALPARVDTRHRSGINVLFGDGAAFWVERKRFDADLAQCTGISPTFNPQQDAIWAALDRR